MLPFTFFGLRSVYSATILKGLLARGARPQMVVAAVEHEPYEPAPRTRWVQASPSWWQRWLGTRAPEQDPLSRMAIDANLPLLWTADANSKRAKRAINSAPSQAFIVAGFSHLFDRELIKMAPQGAINVHPGELPRHRGPAPLFWAIRQGDAHLGLTLHLIDEGEDTGDVLGMDRYTPPLDANLTDILVALAERAVPHCLRGLRDLDDGAPVRYPQPRVDGLHRARRPRFRDGLIDASQSAIDVFRFVRALAQSYSLFVESGGDRFFVADAVHFDSEASLDFEYVLSGDELVLRANPGVVVLRLKLDGALFGRDYPEKPW